MPKIMFYPFNESTQAFAPHPEPSSKFLPEWYKVQPASIGNEQEFLAKGAVNGTIKRCMPIFDIITAGYMITFPMDIYIDATNPDKIEWSVPQSLHSFGMDMVTTHSPEQLTNYPIDKTLYHSQVFRILPFWAIQTDPGYSALFVHPYHRDDLPFHAFSAFVDTDSFISDGHFSMFIKKNFKGVIKQGTPLMQVIPVKRDNWEMEVIPVKKSKVILEQQRLALRSLFKHAYKEKFRFKKEYH